MNIQQIRSQYPQYNDLSDKQLADALHSKFYSDLPIQDYYNRIGFAPESSVISKAKEFLPAPAVDILHQVADVPIGLQKGITQGIRMISDMFGANNAFSQSVKQQEEALASLMSAQARNDQQEIARILKEAEDKGVLDQIEAGVKAFAVAPVDTLVSALGTAAPAIVAALGAKVLGAGALLTTGISMLTGAGMGAGTIKGTIYEETKKALQEAGVPESVAEERAQKAQEYGGQNLDQILIGAGIGGVAAKGPLEKGAVRALANRISKNVAAREAAESVSEKAVKSAATGRIRAGVAEALPEAGQAAQEQVAANIAQQREGLDVPTFRGAVAAGTMEGLAGAGLGATLGGGQPAKAQPAPGALAGETPIERAKRLAAEKAAAEEPAAEEPAPPAAEEPTPPVEAPVAEAPAPEAPPVEEPKVRKAGELPEVLDSETVKKIGFVKGKVHDALVGKSITDPEIRTVLEEYKQRQSANAKTVAKIDAFLARLPEPVAPPEVVETPPAPPAATVTEPAPPPVDVAEPPTETPSVQAVEQPSGAGVPVAGGPAAVTPAEGVGAVEPARVVSAGEDVGQPAEGEGERAAPIAVSEIPIKDIYNKHTDAKGITDAPKVAEDIVDAVDVALKNNQPVSLVIEGKERPIVGIKNGMMQDDKGQRWGTLILMRDRDDPNGARLKVGPPKQPAAPAPAAPAPYVAPAEMGAAARVKRGMRREAPTLDTEEQIDDALAAGLIDEETATRARAELVEPEAPTTAMGAAFQKQIDDIKAQMDALRQKNGKKPAPNNKARKRYDELEAQLQTLVPEATGNLAERVRLLELSSVIGKRGDLPVVDIPLLKENLLKAKATPRMAEAVLTYVGVDQDGNYLPTVYSREEAAEMAGLSRATGSEVSRAAEAMGIDLETRSRFHAGQTDLGVGAAKNVSEEGTGATDLKPRRGVLYETKKKGPPAVAPFLRGALASDGTLDFSEARVPLESTKAKGDKKAVIGLAEMFVRASQFNRDKYKNDEVINALQAEVDRRIKADRKKTNDAITRAYGRITEAEDVSANQKALELQIEKGLKSGDLTPVGSLEGLEASELAALVSEGEAKIDNKTGAISPVTKEKETEDVGPRLSDEYVKYRTIPQSPLVQNRASHAELEKVVADIEKALGGEVSVTILDDITDIDASQQPGTRAGAIVKGEIYLFRSGIAKGIEGQKTIFHELFHKGLNKLLPEAEYRALMNKFYNQSADIRAAADAYLASETGKKDTANLSKEDARILAVEESLADVAEQTQLKPTMVRQVGNFLARVADRIGMPQLARAIRTMGLNEQQKFIQDALQAGLGPSAGGGATRFRVGEERPIRQIGKFGPIENASVFYWSDDTGVAVQVFDQDLIDSGVKLSRAVVDQFDLNISKDRKTAEIHTHGVPPGASAVLSKYKEQISRVKPVGFSGDPYYKFAPGSFSNKDIRELIRGLRDIAVEEGQFDKVETVKIKRATGATAGRASREISREAAMRFRTVTPETEAAVKGVDVIEDKERRSITQRVKDRLGKNPALGVRAHFADSLAPLEEFFTEIYGGMVRTASGLLNPMVKISRALDASRIAKAALEQGTVVDDPSGLMVAGEIKDANGNVVLGADGKPLNYVNVMSRITEAAEKSGKPVDEVRRQVDTVLYGHREYNLNEQNELYRQQADAVEAADPSAKGKAKAAKIREGIVQLAIKDKAKLAELEKAFQNDALINGIGKDLDAIRFALIDKLVEKGRISADKAQEWKDNTGYIPFERIGEYANKYDSYGGTNRGVAALREIRKFEGSKRKSAPVTENFANFVEWATKEAIKNDAAVSALKDMELMGAAFKRDGKPEEDSPGGTVDVFENGTPTRYYVPDPGHLVAFSLRDDQVSDVIKGFQKASQILRAGVTSMPPFAMKQIFDDITRAYAYAGVKNNKALIANTLKNFPKYWVAEIFKKRPKDLKELEALGIVGTYDFSGEGNVKNVLTEAGVRKETLGAAIMRIMEAGAKASDVATRRAIYDQVLKETGDKAQAESAAREVINFSRRGSSRFMQGMIRVVPFFNAYAQGMDKLATAAAGGIVGRKTGATRAMFYKRMLTLTTLGTMHALMMADDDEYQALPDHVRDTNWILPYGKYLGFTPGVPVPAELAFFFKAIPERVIRYYKLQGTEDEQAAVDVLGNLMKRGVDVFSSPNALAQGVRPLLENFVNYSFFLGRPLESASQERERPFMRYGTGTSDAMKALAEKLEDAANKTGIEALAVSPIKLENAYRGIFGTIAGLSLAAADAMINPDRTERPLYKQITAQVTPAGAVMKDAVGTRYLDMVYDLEKRTEQVYNTYNSLLEKAPEKVDQFLQDNIGLYTIRDPLRGLMEGIRELNAQARVIDADKTIDPAERRKEIDRLRAEQNSLARQAYALRRMAFNVQMGLQ
jgi:hypothetical protein